jgi:pyridoxal 5'-phosphate synthase pdxT subunit
VEIGILALQGDVAEHSRALADLGVVARPVRRPDELEGLDGVVLPGGESTTMSLLLRSSGLDDPLAKTIDAGLPVFGTCAGLILLAAEVTDGRPDQRSFGAIDITVRRNGYGRQLNSFESEVDVEGIEGGPVPAVFIRAPTVERYGPDVEVLASHDSPVVCRQGAVLACAFHPELTADRRLHQMFLSMVERRGR